MIAPNHPSNDDRMTEVADGQTPVSRRTRWFLWVFSIVMLATTGMAFVFKLIEFTFSFTGDQPMRFSMIPVLTYLVVAAGFACLFFWAYLTGQFSNVEAPKYRMLQMQEEIDSREAS